MGAAWESNRELGGAPARFVEDIGDWRSKWRASSHEGVEAEMRGNPLVIGSRVPWGRLMVRAPMLSLLLRGLPLPGWRRHGS